MYIHMSFKVELFVYLELADDLLRGIVIHHCLVMRMSLKWFITVTHLPLESLTISFIPYSFKDALAWWLVTTIAKFYGIYLIFLGLF